MVIRFDYRFGLGDLKYIALRLDLILITTRMLVDDMIRMMNFLPELFATKCAFKRFHIKMNHQMIPSIGSLRKSFIAIYA